MDKSLFFSLQNQLDSRWDNLFAHNFSSQYLFLLLCSLGITQLCFSSPAFQAKSQNGRLVSAAAVSCAGACAVGQAGHPHTSQPWIIWSLSGGRDHPHPQPMALLPLHSLPRCGCEPCSRKSVNRLLQILIEEMFWGISVPSWKECMVTQLKKYSPNIIQAQFFA